MKLIELTKGACAEVDDGDFAWVDQWDWSYSGRYAFRPSRKYGTVLLHHVLAPEGFDPETMSVIHVNGDTLDCRRSNLKLVEKQAEPPAEARVDNTSGYPGVTAWGNKWRARVQINGSRVHLGLYDTPEDASAAIAAARATG